MELSRGGGFTQGGPPRKDNSGNGKTGPPGRHWHRKHSTHTAGLEARAGDARHARVFVRARPGLPPIHHTPTLYPTVHKFLIVRATEWNTDLVLPWCAMSRAVVSVVPMADVGDERRRWGCRGRVVERDCGVDLS